MKTKYPAKILLVGEYTVLLNEDVLAVPFSYYSGSWRAGVKDAYPFDLDAFAAHLAEMNSQEITIDVNRIHLDYARDLRFVSNIPKGGGLGSSGSITAAFFDRYIHIKTSHQNDIRYMRDAMAQMEAYFHGMSSGVDPLVSYMDMLYRSLDGEVGLHPYEMPESLKMHVLLTRSVRQTRPLITRFRRAVDTDKGFATAMYDKLIPLVRQFISAYMSGRIAEVEDSFKSISALQWQYFQPMIIGAVRPLWEQSLRSDAFSIKLCGAGGGGAYLACGELPEGHGFKTLRIR